MIQTVKMVNFFLFLFLFFFFFLLSGSTADGQQGTVSINGDTPIAVTDTDFICATLDWWPPTKCDYGTCSWGNASLLNLDLTSTILLNAIKAFSPLKLRLGGTLQDKVRYQIGEDDLHTPCNPFLKNTSELFGFTQGCLPISRWDDLISFFKTAEAKIVFGLNALNGRVIGSDGAATGVWNFSNAESLIRHTVESGYSSIIHGWELGNELSGNGVGTRVSSQQYADDIIALSEVVNDAYKGKQVPLVLGPGGFFDANWYSVFVNRTASSVQAVTHHIYNLGPGVDSHLIDKILNPSYLDGGAEPFRDLQGILKRSAGSSAVAWVGEAGGAYNSGRDRVSNAFVFSFWYLDQLGMSASFDTKTYCRQTLVGGNYGLLNTTTFVPNPDYYSALLWHRLMGTNVLSTSFNGTKKIRAYCHCSKNLNGITLLLINLDNSTTVQVSLSMENAISNKTQQNRKTTVNIRHKHEAKVGEKMMREEYHLTAEDSDLQSQTVLLNGEVLGLSSSEEIPPLEPRKVNPTEPIVVAPYSMTFAQIPYIHVPACNYKRY